MVTDAILMETSMQAFGCSVAGRGRQTNEDRFLIRTVSDHALLMAVADGLGGESGGDVASEIVMRQMASLEDADNLHRRLSELIMVADQALFRAAAETSAPSMGTTLTAVVLRGSFAYYVHVGDSRMYLLRNRKFTQITKDQNMAQFLVDEGEISRDEARLHDARHLLDQCVGCGDCKPELDKVETRPGDMVLLVTDGIYSSLHDETIKAILNRPTDVEKKAQTLLRTAAAISGQDDGTVALATIL